MSHFKAKMHQIPFRLGLRPRPRWGSLHNSPDPLAGFKGPTSKGTVGGRTGGKGKGGGERRGPTSKVRGREGGKGRGGLAPKLKIKLRPCVAS